MGRYKYGKDNSAYKHGEYGTPLYRAWRGMLSRCEGVGDALHKKYYQDKGISVCQEWHDYAAFADWARNNGYADGLSLERKDVDGDYCPENCTWISLKDQAKNRRNTVWVKIGDRRLTLKDAAAEAGVPYKVVHKRYRYRGWSLEDALRIPCAGAGANGLTYANMRTRNA